MKNYVTPKIAATIEQIDKLNIEIEQLRPISPEQEQRIMQKFRLDWNYHSNAIEGNSLTFGETRAFLLYGLTAKGKPFKDYLDIKGHNVGIDYVLDLVKGSRELTEADIRALHKEILVESYTVKAITPDGKETEKHIHLGKYKTLPNHVRTITGEIHYYTMPEETPIKMRELLEWYRDNRDAMSIHPVIFASIFHHRFVAIHPFDDGNGRLARLLMNLILMSYGYPPVVIKQEDRNVYYLALNQADGGEISPLIEYISEALLHALYLYLRGARGESLEEPDDIDKELELLRRELEGHPPTVEQKWSSSRQQQIIQNSLLPLLDKIEKTIHKFRDLFLYFDRKELASDGIGINRDDFFARLKILTNKGRAVLVFQLRGFKHSEPPFGMALKILISFDDLQYNIFFVLDEFMEVDDPRNYIGFSPYKYIESKKLSEPSISKYYHQTLDEEEIDSICHTIGKRALEYIKNKSQHNS